MGDLTAEDRAALLAASMACAHARDAVWRAYRKLRDVEVRLGKDAKDSEGNLLTDRLVGAWYGAAHCWLLIDTAVLSKEDIEWE